MATFAQQPFPEQPQARYICPVPGCINVDAAGQGLPCQRHACKRKTCRRPKAEGSAYCSHHACDLVACSKSRLDTSAFCMIAPEARAADPID
ncbi:hypothetical protein IMZ48_23090 [Candidatus Bathyarchaeota archaeon]|nr:hypothetical protein [Candidatus Bathyarchaeota archaeon]